MRYAIDRLNAGFEMEVCADDFEGEYSVRLSNRFFCPECGESVFWKSKGGRKTRNSIELKSIIDGLQLILLCMEKA